MLLATATLDGQVLIAQHQSTALEIALGTVRATMLHVLVIWAFQASIALHPTVSIIALCTVHVRRMALVHAILPGTVRTVRCQI